MIRVFFFVLSFVTLNSTYSQDELKRSYYFDVVTISDIKDYHIDFIGKSILFINQKDSTYILNIRFNNSSKQVILRDRRKKQIIKFEMDFEYKNLQDLNKLSNSKLYTVVKFEHRRKYKNYVEDFEFERDSIIGKTIVHLTRFKNKKRKKIILENYYFFGVNNNYDKISKLAVKNYVLEKYNLKLKDDEHLEKIISLKNGKIYNEQDNIITKLIDFNFEFKINEIYP